jgi:hypothetical protein
MVSYCTENVCELMIWRAKEDHIYPVEKPRARFQPGLLTIKDLIG